MEDMKWDPPIAPFQLLRTLCFETRAFNMMLLMANLIDKECIWFTHNSIHCYATQQLGLYIFINIWSHFQMSTKIMSFPLQLIRVASTLPTISLHSGIKGSGWTHHNLCWFSSIIMLLNKLKLISLNLNNLLSLFNKWVVFLFYYFNIYFLNFF